MSGDPNTNPTIPGPRPRRSPGSRLTHVAACGALALAAAIGTARYAPAQAQAQAREAREYRTPYRVEFSAGLDELIGDILRTERGDPRIEAEVPHAQWYSRRTLERWHGWGPSPRTYPAPYEVARWPVERKRERVIAVALRFLGYGYQHHHVPDWDPPAHWPWTPTCVGHNGKGVDCSNLTGFVYNLGFGLRLNTDVHTQSEERVAHGQGHSATLRRVELPPAYAERLRVLRTGDLLYIRSRQGRISHVVLWLGPIGRSPDGTPLVIDSHGDGVRDSDGRTIPCGVQLRPFREDSWYNHSASHALRVFHESN